ncbi:MAG: hypothetical protein O3C27_07045 [Actinomycetota bacterium]|nr:hypothetical protein [Actinomycetota bacterium]
MSATLSPHKPTLGDPTSAPISAPDKSLPKRAPKQAWQLRPRPTMAPRPHDQPDQQPDQRHEQGASTTPEAGDYRAVRSWAPALVISLVCGLAAIAVVGNGWAGTDDGAGIVPLVALVSVALAGLRRRPQRHITAVRPVSTRLAHVVHLCAIGLTTVVVLGPSVGQRAIGPAMTLAVLGAYFALWGYRVLALLRTMVLLSALTWEPAAAFVHGVVRRSLAAPSDLLYDRLARIDALGVGDEPWRLFSAQLHRGGLVVIATLALAMGANRWRMSARTLVDLTVTSAVALTVHHTLILGSSIDQYRPSEATQMATDPTLEVLISAACVALLSLVRLRRPGRPDGEGPVMQIDLPELDDRDPVIFANQHTTLSPRTTALLLSGIAPPTAIALLS